MHVSEQCSFTVGSKAFVSLGRFWAWDSVFGLHLLPSVPNGLERVVPVAFEYIRIIGKYRHARQMTHPPAADPEHCSLVQRPGIFEDS